MNGLLQSMLRLIYPHKDPAVIKRKYNMPDTINLSVRLTPEGYFVVTSHDLPGLVTEARDHQELIEMVNDAVLTYFDVPKREADIIYNQFNIGDRVIQYEGKLQTRTA